MKHIILILALFAGGVQAQTLSQCVLVHPTEYKYGTVGRHIVFVCTNEANTILYQDGFSCLHSVCNIDKFSAALVRIAKSPYPGLAVDTEMATLKWDCNNPPGAREKRLCDERMTWVRANWPVWTKDFKLKGQ
jgi:hypothetical protein